MARSKAELLLQAINEQRPVSATYQDHSRSFCPYQLGTKGHQDHVLVWQYDGESQSGELPQWRCLDVAGLRDVLLLDDPWVEAPEPGEPSPCIDFLSAHVAGYDWTRAYLTGTYAPIDEPLVESPEP